jgi:hypothetical protein
MDIGRIKSRLHFVRELQVVDGSTQRIGNTPFCYPTFRPATLREKILWVLGLPHKGPVWREVKK